MKSELRRQWPLLRSETSRSLTRTYVLGNRTKVSRCDGKPAKYKEGEERGKRVGKSHVLKKKRFFYLIETRAHAITTPAATVPAQNL